MALIRWEPARDMQSIQQEMNRLFNTFFDPTTSNGDRQGWAPPMDLFERDEHFLLRVDVPGIAEDDIQIELEDNVLTISGERSSVDEQDKDGYHRIERVAGRFARSLTLPDGINPESIQAHLDKGVLELQIPKPEQRKPRRVAINVGDRTGVIDARQNRNGTWNAGSGQGQENAAPAGEPAVAGASGG